MYNTVPLRQFVRALPEGQRLKVLRQIQTRRPIQHDWERLGRGCCVTEACFAVNGGWCHIASTDHAKRVLSIPTNVIEDAIRCWDDMPADERRRYLNCVLPRQISYLAKREAPVVPIRKQLPVRMPERIREKVVSLLFLAGSLRLFW